MRRSAAALWLLRAGEVAFHVSLCCRCFAVATNGRAVHFEFNMDGSEVMVSDWDPNGAVIVLDSTTLTEIRRFVNLTTPTGKFNVYNTAHDIY
jgi:nitrite reductase (NO-forming)/hydroxylamine reductase